MSRRASLVQPGSPYDALIASWNFLDGSIAPTYGGVYPTFTRTGATATRVNNSGLIETVEANTPRIDYDPVTRACRGWLIERFRSNLNLYSADFSNAVWSRTGATLTSNVAVAPDGTLTADKLVESGGPSAHLTEQNQAALVDNTVYCASFYVQRAERFLGEIRIITKAGTAVASSFNLDTVSVGNPSIAGIEDAGGGWYRIYIVADVLAGATTPRSRIAMYDNAGASTYTGDGVSGFYVWGAQLEISPSTFSASSYIPTTASAAQRNDETGIILTSALSGWNATEFGLYVEFVSNGMDVGSSAINGLRMNSASSANDVVTLRLNSSASPAPVLICTDSVGAQVVSLTGASSSFGAVQKMAARIKANDFAFAANAAAALLDTVGVMPVPDRLYFGTQGSGAQCTNGWLRKAMLFGRGPANAELEAMVA